MDRVDKKIKLFNEILLFVNSYSFQRGKTNFNLKKEAVYIYSYKERIVSLSEGCLLLFKTRNYIETQILSRSALEALFYMLSLINDPGFLRVLIKDHTKQKIKMFNDLNNNKDVALKFKLTNETLKQYLLDLSSQIESFNEVSDMEAKEAAKKADLLNMYMSSYRLLSLATHSKAFIIQEGFSYDKNKFSFKKEQKKLLAMNALDTLIPVLLLMSFTLVSYAAINDVKTEKILKEFQKEYEAFTKK